MRSIDAISKFVFMESQLENSDLIVLPGSLSCETIELAAKLYHESLAPYLLVSGKYAKHVGRFEWEKISNPAYKKAFETEADFMEHGLEVEGVPKSAIIKESQATYTYQNALFTKEIIQEKNINLERIIVVAKDYHSRRSFMYFDYVFPQVQILMAPAKTENSSKETWMTNDYGIDLVMGELGRISQQFQDMYKDRLSL